MRRFLTLVLASIVLGLGPGLGEVDPALAEETPSPAAEAPAEEAPAADEPAAEDPEAPPARRTTPPRRVRRVKVTRDIVFPIVGATRVVNGFGDCRDNCTREHHGNDILTFRWKGLPVVAAHGGVITEIRDDGDWCNVEVTGGDGWHTRYVHLNNDTPGYDDQDYACIPPGLGLGSSVQAGQLIGWVGDSGNAEHTQPHIHFEIRMPSGLPVDPNRSLRAARHIALRQVGGDPAATAAAIALDAYPLGAPTVTVMAIADFTAMLGGGFAPLELDGPLLLSEWETIPEPTLAALAVLAPARVQVVGDLWLPDVLDGLAGRSELLEGSMLEGSVATEVEDRTRSVESAGPVDEQADDHPDGLRSEVIAPEASAPAPFSLVFLGDRAELDSLTGLTLDHLATRVATIVMDFVEPEDEIGSAAFQGLGRSGTRNTLYYATGGEWATYRAREAPEESPGYGWFVVDPASLTLETVVFLNSITDAPVMPVWR